MEFLILGPLEARNGVGPLPLGGAKQRAALAILLLHRNEVVSRDRLIDGLWGETPPPSAAHTLETYISRLRKALYEDGYPERLLTRPPGYLIRVEKGELDLERVELLIDQGRRAQASHDPSKAAVSFREGLALFRGAPLEDLSNSPFAQPEIGRLDELRLDALEQRIDAELAVGSYPKLVGELEALVARYPLRERSWAQLMLALYASGRQGEALEAFERARIVLAEDLGIDPGPILTDVQQRILRQDPELAPAPAPAGSLEGGVFGIPEATTAQTAARWIGRFRVSAPLILLLTVFLIAGIAVPIALHRGATAITSIEPNAAAIIDLGTGRIVGSVPVGQSPDGIAEGAGFVWVANSGDDTVSKIDPDTRSVVDQIQVGADPTAIAFGDGEIWATAAGDRMLDEISPTTDRIVRRIAIGGGADAVAVGQGGVWVADSADNVVLRIDPGNAQVLGRVPVGVSPSAIAIGDSVWVANTGSDNVSRLAPATGAVTGTIPVGMNPAGIATTTDSVWVANSTDGTVTRIDPASARADVPLRAGDGPDAVVVAGGSIWVTNQYGNSISRIDQSSGSTIQIPLGSRPMAAAVVGGSLWTVVQASAGAHDGGTLALTGGFIDQIDPNLGWGTNDWQLSSLTNDGLVGFERTGGLQSTTIVPDLAMSIPAPTDGGRAYTFQLRQGVRYSTGAVVKPEDFRAAIERSFQGDELGQAFYMALVGAEACSNDPLTCDLRRAITTDDVSNTVTFHLKKQDPDFLYKLALPGAFAVPVGTQVTDAEPKPAPAPATGPYMIVSYRPGESLELVRNPRFQEWSSGAQPQGFPDRITWSLGVPSAAEVSRLQAGTSDVMLDTPPAERLHGLSVQFAGRLHTFSLTETDYLWLNTRIAPFDSVLARRAVNYAVDRGSVVRSYGGSFLARTTCQVLPPNMAGYVPYCPYTVNVGRNGKWTEPDQTKARQLVARSGTRGEGVVLLVRASSESEVLAAHYLVSVLDSLGYQARLKAFPAIDPTRAIDPMSRAVTSGKFQAGINGWLADYPAPYDFIGEWFSCASPLKSAEARFCDPHVQGLIDRAVQTQSYDPASAPELWANADHAIVDAAPWVPLVNPLGVNIVSARVGNYQNSQPYSGILLDQLWVR